jgi:hypothetical protein
MARKGLNGERLLDTIVRDLEHQRPQLSKKQADQLDAGLNGQWASTRRAGLAALTVNGKGLVKAIAGRKVDQAAAIEKVTLAYSLRTYADRLRSFALMMDSASTRISLAARWRDDYEAVADAAGADRRAEPPVVDTQA